jgi:ppGpp synthetase/RelA/SpoT-type nucleotidyltranferase
MKTEELTFEYSKRIIEMEKVLPLLKVAIDEALEDNDGIRIDQFSCRIKDVKSFIKKSEKKEDGKLKYECPFRDIQDQIGARIVVFYVDEVEPMAKKIKEYFTFIEEKRFPPETFKEFSYEGRHFILNLEKDILPDGINKALIPEFFELQIKTLFQHAWAQAEHDVGYKETRELEFDEKRRLAFAAAQAWGADRIFSEILQQE